MEVVPANQERFEAVCQAVRQNVRHTAGIGCLAEKSLHATLKSYVAGEFARAGQEAVRQETRVGAFVADIASESGIVEIQTQQLYRLRRKLEAFLPVASVAVVFPVACTKWIVGVQEETGAVVRRRKSPRQGRVYDLLPELYALRPFLSHPRLRFWIFLLDMEEIRLLAKEKRHARDKGYTRQDMWPLALRAIHEIADLNAYGVFVPDSLPETFTTRDYQRETRLSGRRLHQALGVLLAVGAIQRSGKSGRFNLYRKMSGYKEE